jgi:hypothetical protein
LPSDDVSQERAASAGDTRRRYARTPRFDHAFAH